MAIGLDRQQITEEFRCCLSPFPPAHQRKKVALTQKDKWFLSMGDHYDRAVPDAVENCGVAASEDGDGGEHSVRVFCTNRRCERLECCLESDCIPIQRAAIDSFCDWLLGHDLVTSPLAIPNDCIAKPFTFGKLWNEIAAPQRHAAIFSDGLRQVEPLREINQWRDMLNAGFLML
ncbi:hypothetical protein [Ralstonia sp. 1138]|uniref:hypothetical protein n=1 Tax=Ralstonia sp. 1138 TaxID=3156423 RepID=UPI0033951A6A